MEILGIPSSLGRTKTKHIYNSDRINIKRINDNYIWANLAIIGIDNSWDYYEYSKDGNIIENNNIREIFIIELHLIED